MHAGREIADRLHAFLERRGPELRARIAAGLVELGEDVLDRRHTELRVGELLGLERAQHGGLANQLADPDPGARHDALDDGVGLGVDGGRIERVVAVHDPQEPGGLFERTRADARDLQELPAVPERAMLVAERDDVLRERFVEAGDPREERGRRGIQIGADGVDAVLDDGVELPRELGLVEIVLVLADADRLRLDAHELGERILQPPRDRDGAAQRHVEIGQLLRGQLRRRVHRCAGLGDHDLREREVRMALDQIAGERVGLARGRAVANRDELHAVPRAEGSEGAAASPSQSLRGSCG